MGYNLFSACHKCKVKLMHFRTDESKTILPFYIKHKECSKIDLNNVVTIMDNHGAEEPDWCQDPNDDPKIKNGGYPDDTVIPFNLKIIRLP